MPFTFSHPAAVLPFCKTNKLPVSVTGLVVGSMVPDFEFLFLLRESDYIGHLWPGIILFNLPAAIAAAFIFHLLVRDQLIIHLPPFLQQRFVPFISFDWTAHFKKHYLSFILSVMGGVATHVFIDAFTHQDGFMTRPVSFFHSQVNLLQLSLPVYYFLQLLSSVLGAAYMLWFVLRLPKEKGLRFDRRPVQYWLIFFIAIPAVLLIRFTITKNHNTSEDVIIAATGSLVYALLITSMFNFRKKQEAGR
ncbi:MAG: DUF4184 family protein [Ferruginibacter sp.]